MRKSKLLFLLLFALLANAVSAQSKLPVVVEVIMKNVVFNGRVLNDMKRYGITDVKLWHNRLVVYAKTSNPEKLKSYIAAKYPKDEIVLFEKPFYDFERSRCTDKSVATQWQNIILTANLVKDPKLQQEYLNYHATQFEKWPEVAQGFCNASFQQLLVFRNGRQLMLIISIPKGKTLDELNPLTSKNNPRVDEWNKLMAKYQEGIEGTKKGETWVFFQEYTQ